MSAVRTLRFSSSLISSSLSKQTTSPITTTSRFYTIQIDSSLKEAQPNNKALIQSQQQQQQQQQQHRSFASSPFITSPCLLLGHHKNEHRQSSCDEQIRAFSFSYAGPRKLNDILKINLLEGKTKDEIGTIWSTYHDGKEGIHGTVLDGKDCGKVLSRASQCPFFIQPVFREDGFFMLVSQFQSPCHFLMAYLEDYKMDPSRAQPLITLSVFDDLVTKYDIGLVRCDVTNKGIQDEEAKKIFNCLVDAYRVDEEYFKVQSFNQTPGTFDVDDYVACSNRKWKDDDDDGPLLDR